MKPKMRMKIIEADNASSMENQVNDFMEEIDGYGYELSHIKTLHYPEGTNGSQYVALIEYYEKFEEDPWKELNARLEAVEKQMKRQD